MLGYASVNKDQERFALALPNPVGPLAIKALSIKPFFPSLPSQDPAVLNSSIWFETSESSI